LKRSLAALLLFGTTAFAQVSENITVEVIEVPVYVTAPGGVPVRGLTKDAFELFVDGKPQPVDYFDAVDYGAEPPAASASPQAPPLPRDVRERRLYLLLFDLGYSIPAQIARAQKAANDAVDRANPSSDYFAVATFSFRGGVQFVIPFMRDHAAIHRAIDSLAPSEAKDPLRVAISIRERRRVNESALNAASPALTTEEDQLSPEAAETIQGGPANQDVVRMPLRRNAQEQMHGLEEAAKRLASLEGQKHVILVSRGWGFWLVPETGQGYVENPEMRRMLEDMVRAFRGAGAFLDTFDAIGYRGNNEALRRMAEQTGGEFVKENDFGAALKRLTTEQQAVYLLGFRRRSSGSGSIDVKVNGVPRGTTVSFRTGFGSAAERGQPTTLQLADIILNDIPQNGVTVALGATPRAGGADVELRLQRREIVPQLPAGRFQGLFFENVEPERTSVIR